MFPEKSREIFLDDQIMKPGGEEFFGVEAHLFNCLENDDAVFMVPIYMAHFF